MLHSRALNTYWSTSAKRDNLKHEFKVPIDSAVFVAWRLITGFILVADSDKDNQNILLRPARCLAEENRSSEMKVIENYISNSSHNNVRRTQPMFLLSIIRGGHFF